MTLLRTCLAALLSLSFTLSLANHHAGSFLTVKYTGTGNVYEIKYVYYRDCSGAAASGNETINYNIDGVGFNQIVIPLISNTEVPTGHCFTNTMGCAIGDGLEECVYKGTITLNSTGSYKFFVSACCRQPFTTITSNGYYVIEANIIVKAGFIDNLPDFISYPEFYFCLNTTTSYHSTAVDADGDSLVYSFAAPLEANPMATGGQPVNYVLPFSPTNFITMQSAATIDQTDGTLIFTPVQTMAGVMVIKVDEYRNGNPIGSVTRETMLHAKPGIAIGIDEELQQPVFVHPNPVADILYIKTTGELNRYSITDLSGRLMMEGAFSDPSAPSIHVEKLSKGAYILKIETAKSLKAVRIFKN